MFYSFSFFNFEGDAMFDDFFDDFVERMFRESFAEPEINKRYSGYAGPVYDVWEGDNKVYVIAELPGASEKDVSVEIVPYAVRIISEAKGNHRYYKNIRLPAPVKKEPIAKTFKNGVLELILEKDLTYSMREYPRRKRIEVK